MAKLPKAVQRAKDRADKAIESLNNPQQQTLEEPEQPVPEAKEGHIPEEQPQEVQKPVHVEERVELGSNSDPEAAHKEEKDKEYYEHRLKTVQGMWEADKKRLQEQLIQRDEQFNQLQKQLNELRLQERQRKTENFDLSDILSKDELDSYDQDQIDLIRRAAAKAAKTAIEESSARFEDLVSPVRAELDSIKESAAQSKEETFWETIDTLVTNWREINSDPDFHKWLAERDPLTDIRRQDALADAQSKLRAKKVVDIFKLYLKDKKAVKPDNSSRITPDPVAASVEAPVGDAISRDMITEHYRRITNGYYRNRAQEREEMERKINQAYAAGRVF